MPLREIIDFISVPVGIPSPVLVMPIPGRSQVFPVPDFKRWELEHLKKLISDIPVEYFNIDPNIPIWHPQDEIPYIPVLEWPTISMGIFILAPGTTIPLHDHPCMYAFTRVLFGSVSVREFDIVGPANGGVIAKEKDTYVLTPPFATVITPFQSNVHQFIANTWTAVLDVLLPPYRIPEGRESKYYEQQGMTNNYVYLKEISCPLDFKTTILRYNGRTD